MRFFLEFSVAYVLVVIISKGLFNYTPGFIIEFLIVLLLTGIIHGIVNGSIAVRARNRKFSEDDLKIIMSLRNAFYLEGCSFEVNGGLLDIRFARVWIMLMNIGEGRYKVESNIHKQLKVFPPGYEMLGEDMLKYENLLEALNAVVDIAIFVKESLHMDVGRELRIRQSLLMNPREANIDA